MSQYVQTKDMMLDDQKPMFRHSLIEYMRLLFEGKTTATIEAVTFTHHGDRVVTVTGVSDQVMPVDVLMSVTTDYMTQDCTLGPNLYHNITIGADVTTAVGGLELSGMGLYYEPYNVIGE